MTHQAFSRTVLGSHTGCLTAVWLRSPKVAESIPESGFVQQERPCSISLVEYERFPPSLFRVSRLTLSLAAVRGVVRRGIRLCIYAVNLSVYFEPHLS